MNSTSDPLSLANLRACATASKLAYTNATLTDPISREQVFISAGGPATIIAFPGTHDLRDIFRDLECLRLRALILGRPCSVHAGFDRVHHALIKQIIAAFSVQRVPTVQNTDVISPSPLNGERVGVRGEKVQLQQKVQGEDTSDDLKSKSPSEPQLSTCCPLLITGHSKGAAVAKRCALALVENNIPVTAVITFGEPRGGDSRYALLYHDALGDRTLRVTNAADPIPWLPAWLAGNRHCGPEAFMPARKNILITGPALISKIWSDGREIYEAWKLKNLAPLTDHHIDTYLRRLAALSS